MKLILADDGTKNGKPRAQSLIESVNNFNQDSELILINEKSVAVLTADNVAKKINDAMASLIEDGNYAFGVLVDVQWIHHDDFGFEIAKQLDYRLLNDSEGGLGFFSAAQTGTQAIKNVANINARYGANARLFERSTTRVLDILKFFKFER